MLWRRATAGLAAAAMAASGCAAPPGGGPPGRLQPIHVSSSAYAEVKSWAANPYRDNPGEISGVECTASNDRGAWTVATPGELLVEVTEKPLAISCRKEGYREAKLELRCVSPATRYTATGALVGLQLVAASGPAAAYALPSVGVFLAVMAGAAALGGAVGHAAAGPDSDACTYGGMKDARLQVYLDRLQ